MSSVFFEAIFPAGVNEITVNGLYQWDKGIKLKITITDIPILSVYEVHFEDRKKNVAYPVKGTVEDGVLVVDVPNIILQHGIDTVAWIYNTFADSVGKTEKKINLPIKKREKPADYVYEQNLSGPSFVLIDDVTGKEYTIYISNGKLMFKEV